MVSLTDLLQLEWFWAVLILVVAILVAEIIHLIVHRYARKLAKKTKSDVDDLIVRIATKPFYILILFAGFYFSLRTLSVLQPYWNYIQGVSYVFFVFLITLVVSRILGVLLSRWIQVKKKYEKTPVLINKAVKVIIYLFAFLMILNYFNVEVTPLLATLGLGGLAVGLALQNTLSNFFAGIHILSDRPINVGDFIEIEGGTSGYVEDIGWRSTRIRTLPNLRVIVPNAKLSDSIIINKSMPDQQSSVNIQCGVSYNSDLEKVERVTIQVAKKILKSVEGAVPAHEPFIRYHTFGDSNIEFSIILRAKHYTDKYLITHEFIKALKSRYDKEKIDISWPVVKVVKGR